MVKVIFSRVPMMFLS